MDLPARAFDTQPVSRAHWRGLAQILAAGLVVAFPSMAIPAAAWWPGPEWLYWAVWEIAAVALVALVIGRYVSERRAAWLLIGTVALIAALSMVFNITAVDVVAHVDRNQALIRAVTELAHGRYPYYARTQLGNPISPLPGALLLAAPFVLGLGSSAFQSYFWLLVLAAVLANYLKSARLALLIVWCALLSPMVVTEFMFQSDLMANSMYVLIGAIWFVRYPGRWWAGVFLGIALASRVNALFYFPLLFAFLARRDGLRPAVRAGLVPLATVFLLIGPFYLYDPAGFSPLHTFSKITIPGMPAAALAIEVISVAAVLLLALCVRWAPPSVRVPEPGTTVLWASAAAAQAVPVLLAVAASLAAGEPGLNLADHVSFGQNFVLVALLAIFCKFALWRVRVVTPN